MISTRDFIPSCGCRSAGECTHGLFDEDEALRQLVRAVSREMIRKLIEKLYQGWHGWDDAALLPMLKEKLREHVERGFDRENMIDVMNLAAMIWNLETP